MKLTPRQAIALTNPCASATDTIQNDDFRRINMVCNLMLSSIVTVNK